MKTMPKGNPLVCRGDIVTHPDYDGVWKVYGRHPQPGRVWIEPYDKIATAIALWVDYGMIGTLSRKLTRYHREGSTMEFEFVDAAYIAPKGGTGKPAEPNPFTQVVADIALKTTVIDGKPVPVSKAVTLSHDKTEEAANKEVQKRKGQLQRAGAANNPQVTVVAKAMPLLVKQGAVTVPAKDKTVLTFWTTPKRVRTVTPKTTDAVTPEAETVDA